MAEGGEPSMEEILSSIKRIIADEEPKPPRGRRIVGQSVGEPQPEPDVLDLTEPVDPAAPEPLTSPQTQAASRQRLEALSRVEAAPARGNASLEDTVRDMLRPMLAAWLDKQLPEIVERMVAIEIARITGRG